MDIQGLSKMRSAAETIVSIDTLENLGNVDPINSMPSTGRVVDQDAPSLSRSRKAETSGKGEHDLTVEFRDTLVRVSSSKFSNFLKLFMARSDEYPRFVWQDVLRSYSVIKDNPEQIGKFGSRKFSHIIEAYPDVLQRELMRDSIQLGSRVHDHYGALHAAVCCGRVDLVLLLIDPEMSRKKILSVLTPTVSDVIASDCFHIIRRALLWSHMQSRNDQYTKVATFMKDFEKVRKPSEVELLRLLIDRSTADQIDLNDSHGPDVWAVVLAWAFASPRRRHIIREFKKKKPNIFDHIVDKSSFKCCLSGEIPDWGEEDLGESGKQQVERLDHIVKLLVLEKTDAEPASGNPGQSDIIRQRSLLFLYRLSDRTPQSWWTPLHLAAARGDKVMVSIFIRACDKILKSLGDGLRKLYTLNLQNSFFDAKFMTPLHHAVLGNHSDVVESLMRWEIFQPYVTEVDIFMRTAFQMACSNPERPTIVRELMKNQQIDVNAKDCCSFTCLHWAVKSLSIEVVKVLIFEGKKRMIRTTEKDIRGRHPYELAARLKGRGHNLRSLKDIQQQLLSSPPVKDEVETLYRDRQVYVDASNAILVGAALIASVTFGGWLQPPFGNDEISPTDGEISMFWAFSSLSFFFSIATVMAGAAAVLPIKDEYIKDSVVSIRQWLLVTSFLLILSVSFVLGAFATAGFAALAPRPHLRKNMTITTSIGTVVCSIVGLGFCSRLLKWFNKEDAVLLFNSLRQFWRSSSHRRLESELPSFGPEKDPPFKRILESVPTITQELYSNTTSTPRSKDLAAGLSIDSPPPPGVDRERILNLWMKSTHDLQDRKKTDCMIQDCYQHLESYCRSEILACNIDMVVLLKEYVEMWTNLGKDPLNGITLEDQVMGTSLATKLLQAALKK